MRLLNQLLLACSLMIFHAGSMAGTGPAAEVMLFGVFHFANPARDVVKTDQVNVMTAENQDYLEGLARRVAAFKPTAVLLEFNPDNESAMQ